MYGEGEIIEIAIDPHFDFELQKEAVLYTDEIGISDDELLKKSSSLLEQGRPLTIKPPQK